MQRAAVCSLLICSIAAIGIFGLYSEVSPCAEKLNAVNKAALTKHVLDRTGHPLVSGFTGEWNTTDQKPLHAIPPLLQQAFLEAEDHRFYSHRGIDWIARLHALWQNISSRQIIRGASTITEQVVRMVNPRTRSVRARLIEGIEAHQLEQRLSKASILQFYLNQVPFARQRRGVVQAARLYFNRDLETLTQREMLTLAVLVRAPDRLDLLKNPSGVTSRVQALATKLLKAGSIQLSEYEQIALEKIEVVKGTHTTMAPHFVQHVQHLALLGTSGHPLLSTIDPDIQRRCQEILDSRIADLAQMRVGDGAALVVDARSAEVLAWVNAGPPDKQAGGYIDAVTTPRQPGSTLKPFLYALALSKGWSAATQLDDSPLVEPVGSGLHTYRNYSRMHYGNVSLREALGNSLNIPAIKTIQFTGNDDFLQFLKQAGFNSLTEPAEHYGEGLALGNGEVTLFELVQAYTALATRGIWRPLNVRKTGEAAQTQARARAIMTAETSSIIAHILSDPYARRLEFGAEGVLRLPVQTAVKTGTSTGYRDAWAIGYSHNFVVGVWLGNLDNSPMREISGARGPALVLRSIFAHLEGLKESRDLYQSQLLTRHTICPTSGMLAGTMCQHVSELFVAGSEPSSMCTLDHTLTGSATYATRNATAKSLHPERARIALPSHGLHLALDPRIPDSHEMFGFELESPQPITGITWIVDGESVATYRGDIRRHLWQLKRGRHTVRARVSANVGQPEIETDGVEFFVR